MVDDEKWEWLESAINKMRQCDDVHREATRKMMIEPESPLSEPYSTVSGLLIEALEKIAGDEYETISWFAIDCDYGRKSMEAGVAGQMRKIETVSDLRWLIGKS